MSIEVVQGLQRKATFKIKKNDVKASIQTELKKYAKDAKIQGFRPGKVPAKEVERIYGGKAYEDALNIHINHKFTDLVFENKLELSDYPKFDLSNNDGEEFTFEATFEVMPTIKFGDFSTLEIEKPKCDVTDEATKKTITMLRKQRATYTKSTSNTSADDRLTIDFVGTIDGVEFEGGKAENYQFILGKGMMLPDFEAGLYDKKIGENVTVDVSFPDNYHAENLKGKKAIFNITIRSIENELLPELTPDFIISLGVTDGTDATLYKEIKNNLTREIERRLHIKTRENVLNGLSKISPIDVPHTLVHNEIHEMMKNTEENMKKQGYQPNQIKLTHDMFELDAKRIVTMRLLVQEYIKQNKVTINDDEVKDVITDIASMYENPNEYINWYYTNEGRVNNAKAITMENKVISQILAQAKVIATEISYDDLMSQQM